MEETTNPRVFLVVVDESEELQTALHYAARRAAHTGGRIAPLAGTMPIVYIREGRRRDELLALIAEEPSISILVLAAGTGPEGPGPLITYLTGKPAARLRIPITIVPGGLTLAQLDAVS